MLCYDKRKIADCVHLKISAIPIPIFSIVTCMTFIFREKRIVLKENRTVREAVG